MTRRELVINALNHIGTDPIPYHMDFTYQALDRLIEHTGDDNIESKMDSCISMIQYWGWPSEIEGKPDMYLDEFGVVWNRSGADKEIGIVENPVIEDIEDHDYKFPTPDIARLRKDIEGMLQSSGDRFKIIGFGFCMFERSWSLMGMENVLMSMIASPNELEKLYDDICDYMLRLVDVALEYDTDGIYFGDDWGQQKGLIMGPEHWRKFIKPRMKRLYERVKQKGKFVLQHSCGDCFEIFPDLIEIGLDCYQTFQPEVYDIHEFKRIYGDKLAVWGGVSTQQALPYMSVSEIKEEIVRVAGALFRDGGLIIAPTHALSFDISPENIIAMNEVFQNQKNYFDFNRSQNL